MRCGMNAAIIGRRSKCPRHTVSDFVGHGRREQLQLSNSGSIGLRNNYRPVTHPAVNPNASPYATSHGARISFFTP